MSSLISKKKFNTIDNATTEQKKQIDLQTKFS